MTTEVIEVICLSALGAVVLVGIFVTKTAGWGRYSTSTLILATALFVAGFFLLTGKIEAAVFVNILFAVIGYAGGLINGKKENSTNATMRS